MTIGNPQSITFTGVNITFGAAAAFDSVFPGTRRFLWVKNGSGVSTTVVIVVPGATFGQNNPDTGGSVPAGEDRMFGPLDPELINTATGAIDVVCNPVTSITVAAVDLPTPPPDLP